MGGIKLEGKTWCANFFFDKLRKVQQENVIIIISLPVIILSFWVNEWLIANWNDTKKIGDNLSHGGN